VKFKSIYFILACVVVLFACRKDKDNDDDPNLEPGILTGTQSAPLTIKNIFSNPNREDYIVTGTWRINAPVEVEPGVRFQMGPGARIEVQAGGSFKADGTAQDPIFFEGEQSAKGFWDYLQFVSNNPNNLLNHCHFAHGGGSSLSAGSATVALNSNAQLAFTNSTIKESQRNGILMNHNDSRLSSFENITISDCTLFPISIKLSQIESINETIVFTSGNGFNQIEVNGLSSAVPLTIPKASGPYLFKGTSSLEAATIISAGTEIHIAPSAKFEIRSSGSLRIEGEAQKRVKITGDQAAKGYWDYIYFNGSLSPSNQFSYTDITYGGGSNLSCCRGIIALSNSALSMENSSITHSLRYGIVVRSNSTFDDRGGNVFSENELGDMGN